MNHIKHLSGFFNKSILDDSITTAHISLYFTLFQRWNLNRFRNPIIISRAEIMVASKIKSKATYHKCIKDLHQMGYIIYKPSFNSYEGTEVILPDLSSVIELQNGITIKNKEKKEIGKYKTEIKTKIDANKSNSASKISIKVNKNTSDLEQNKPISHKTCSYFERTCSYFGDRCSNFDTPSSNYEQVQDCFNNTGSSSEQPKKETTETLANADKSEASSTTTSSAIERSLPAVEQDEKNGYILYNNTIKKLNNNVFNSNTITSVGVKNEKLEKPIQKTQKFTPPNLETIQEFFLNKMANVIEAEKFFNYYASNGWLVGGKTKMKDWEAAARNWILNMQKYQVTSTTSSPKPNNLHVNNLKNYAEPL